MPTIQRNSLPAAGRRRSRERWRHEWGRANAAQGRCSGGGLWHGPRQTAPGHAVSARLVWQPQRQSEGMAQSSEGQRRGLAGDGPAPDLAGVLGSGQGRPGDDDHVRVGRAVADGKGRQRRSSRGQAYDGSCGAGQKDAEAERIEKIRHRSDDNATWDKASRQHPNEGLTGLKAPLFAPTPSRGSRTRWGSQSAAPRTRKSGARCGTLKDAL